MKNQQAALTPGSLHGDNSQSLDLKSFQRLPLTQAWQVILDISWALSWSCHPPLFGLSTWSGIPHSMVAKSQKTKS